MKTFALLAYVIGSGHLYVLDYNMSGADCVAAIEAGITHAEVEPAFPCEDCDVITLDLSGAVLSCEEEKG